MSSPLRKIFSDTIIYTIGSVFNRLLPFLLLPVYTHYFNPETYGIYSLVYSFWFFVVVIYLFGTESSFQKSFMEAVSIDQKREIFSSLLLVIFLVSLVFSTLIYSFSESISFRLTGDASAIYYIKLLSVILLLDSVSRYPMIVINSEQRSLLYAVINAISVIVNVFLNLVLIVKYRMGIEAIFYSYIVSYSVLLLISMIYCREYLRFKINLKSVKVLLRSSYLFMIYGLFLIAIDLIDRYLIEYFRGTAEVGLYSASYRIGIVMNLLITGFKIAWTPFFLNLKDQADNRDIISKIFTYFWISGLCLFLFFSLFVDDIVKINIAGFTLLDAKYRDGLVIVPYVLASYLFHGLFLNITVSAFYFNKIEYIVIASAVGCFLNIAGNLILIPLLSITGAAVSTLLSYVIMFVTLYIFSQRLYYIKYQWKIIFCILLVTIILLILNIYSGNFITDSNIRLIFEFTSVILLCVISLVTVKKVNLKVKL